MSTPKKIDDKQTMNDVYRTRETGTVDDAYSHQRDREKKWTRDIARTTYNGRTKWIKRWIHVFL